MSEYINDILKQIDECINTDTFIHLEKSKVELKDLSTGDKWISLHETVCAFLNTDGGYIICGVRERDKKYFFTSFDRNKDPKIIDLQTKIFQDDNSIYIDLTDFISFEYISFRTGEVLLITVKGLSDDLKYLRYKSKYWERKLTGDYEISLSRLNQQKEYKLEIEYAKELKFVEEAKLDDLSLDKINQFINLLNQSSKKETLKPSLSKAKQFLEHRHFIKNDKVTTLGMLVCGDDPFRFLEYRAEVDCYYDSSSSISKDKKDFQSDVLTLMDEALRFVWGHIRTGRIIEEGGKTIPEYPEELVRETINNSLAHRDYTINRFVTLNIEPGKYLQIKNPGAFKERIKLTHTETEIPVRRLIPGIPESKNPKLASVLKAFDKIESQGRGMASLVSSALDNKIDLPYYELQDDTTISLTIPSGKLLDEETEGWIRSYEKYITKKLKKQLKEEHKIILAYFRKSELLNKRRFYTILLSESNNHFIVIEELTKAGLIYEHPASNDSTPVFIIDRELLKTDFTDELIALMGNDFISYNSVSKAILNILYRYTKYNEEPVKPALITPEVYFLEYGPGIVDPKKYETLGRKLRGICRKLHEQKILLKSLNGAYMINLIPNQNSLHYKLTY